MSKISKYYFLFLTIFFVFSSFLISCSQEMNGKKIHMDQKTDKDLKLATFGAGCFWCVEAVFQELKGVYKVVSGYSGGKIENPTYEY